MILFKVVTAVGPVEDPGTLTQGAPVFPGSSRLGIEPKTPGWLVQDCVCFENSFGAEKFTREGTWCTWRSPIESLNINECCLLQQYLRQRYMGGLVGAGGELELVGACLVNYRST